MKTTLFNTDTNETTGVIREGYYFVDGVRPELPENIVELEVTETGRPQHDTLKQFATYEWLPDFENNQYVQVWTIHDKDDTELIEDLKQQGESAVRQVKYQLWEKEVETKYNENLATIATLDDEAALKVAEQFSPFNPDGFSYETNNRFYYPVDGKLYKVLQNHTSAAQWLPNEAVSLYVEVVPQGQAVPWNVADYASYEVGTKVTHNGHTWECINPTYAWIEPGTQDSHYGWTDLGLL